MIKIDDHTLPGGAIDWPSYKRAQVDAGEVCYRCGSYIFKLIGGRVGLDLCGQCMALDRDRDEVVHDRMIRCPACGETDNISDWDSDYGEIVYGEGTHEVTCAKCEHVYEIETHVRYSYTSPKRE